MFVVTARLVQPLPGDHVLPTDNFVAPSRAEFFMNGQLEGTGHPDVPLTERQRQQMQQQQPAAATEGAPASSAAPGSSSQSAAPSGQGGFQMK
jgi:pilus assembly protein CpaC